MATLQVVTLSSLLGTWLYEQSYPQGDEIRDTSKLILLLASIQYIGTVSTRGSPVSEQLRYADWLLTTPLLLRMMYLYALRKLPEEKAVSIRKTFFPILVLDVLMVVLGYLAEYVVPKYRTILTALSFGCLLAVQGWIGYLWYIVKDQLEGTARTLWSVLTSFFIFLWPVYGIAFTFKEKLRTNIYSTLDLLNKSVFSLLFLRLVSEDGKKVE